MTHSRYFSGSKPQSVEDRIGGGAIGFPLDPLLHPRQPLGRLMDIVAVGEVGECLEQLLEAFSAAEDSGAGCIARTASRRPRRRPRLLMLTHSSAFPRGCSSGTQSRSVAS